MAGKGLEQRGEEDQKEGGRKEPCGEEDTHKALIITLFFVAPQEKLKSAGRKDWFCKNNFITRTQSSQAAYSSDHTLPGSHPLPH